MKSAFKWLAILSAMGASFAAGYFVAKNKLESEEDEKYEELETYYKDKYEKEYKKPQNDIQVESVIAEKPMYQYDIPKDAVLVSNKEIEEKVATNYKNMISVITPMEYGEDISYDTVGLTYYADGTLARDDDDDIIHDIDDVIGLDSIKYLGEYEDSVLYIKNDITKEYYEVTESPETYTQATGILI